MNCYRNTTSELVLEIDFSWRAILLATCKKPTRLIGSGWVLRCFEDAYFDPLIHTPARGYSYSNSSVWGSCWGASGS